MVQALDISYLSIRELGSLYRRRELSPVEVVRQLLERAELAQARCHAFITPTPEIALREAEAAEAALMQGETDYSPLLGIPVAYKDIVMTKGVRTTCGSALHLDWVPDADAAVVERWRGAGAVMLGKLATSEFAMGTQAPEHPIAAARNPWNPAHTPGGSSSGSGAALAAGRCVSLVEAYAYHATDLAELPDKYPPQLEHRLKAGGHFFASEYVQSQRIRAIVVEQVRELFSSIDLMLCPTMRGEAPTYEESLGDMWVRRPGITSLFNFAGLPALAFPIGFSAHALPLSGQLVGRPFDEATVLRAAHAYQGMTDWHRRHPDM